MAFYIEAWNSSRTTSFVATFAGASPSTMLFLFCDSFPSLISRVKNGYPLAIKATKVSSLFPFCLCRRTRSIPSMFPTTRILSKICWIELITKSCEWLLLLFNPLSLHYFLTLSLVFRSSLNLFLRTLLKTRSFFTNFTTRWITFEISSFSPFLTDRLKSLKVKWLTQNQSVSSLSRMGSLTCFSMRTKYNEGLYFS